MNLKLKDIMPLVFVIITGSLNSISVIDAMSLLGPDMTRYRFRSVLNKLGGFTEQEVDVLIQKYK
jgi:glutamyl-tRNA synthetase